jgi:hypothetical protein
MNYLEKIKSTKQKYFSNTKVVTFDDLSRIYGKSSKSIANVFYYNKKDFTKRDTILINGDKLKQFIEANMLDEYSDHITTLRLFSEEGTLKLCSYIKSPNAIKLRAALLDVYFKAKDISNSHQEQQLNQVNNIEEQIKSIIKKELSEPISEVTKMVKIFEQRMMNIEDQVRKKVDRNIPKSIEDEYVPATTIGMMLESMPSGEWVNQRLVEIGLLRKHKIFGSRKHEWIPTEKGKNFCQYRMTEQEDGTGYGYLIWKRKVKYLIDEHLYNLFRTQ